jgi:carbon storage regulator
MLVLSRKKGEVINIGKSVSVQVIDFGKGIVSLGIIAPKNIPVHRKEIFDEIVEQNKQAMNTNISNIKKALLNTSIINDTSKIKK